MSDVDPTAPLVPIDPDSLPAQPAIGEGPGRLRLGVILAVSAGGAVGSFLRYRLGQVYPVHSGHLPTTTMAINLSGSLVLGVVLIVLIERLAGAILTRAFMAIGVVGAFTTFSTFTVDTAKLIGDHELRIAATYVFVSVLGGLLAGWIGSTIGRAAHRRVPSQDASRVLQ